MTNLFKHETPKTKLFLYVEHKGDVKGIKFYNKESAYSGSPNGRGGFYDIEIESRHIEIVDIHESRLFDTIYDFLKWKNDAQKEFNAFIEEHNITKEDLKLRKIEFNEPIESDVFVDWSVF